jgi:uncharacterized protein involved in exopolysaccharide biosynthesis/Mrp family chromosome partitioning ATPase
MNHKPDGQVQAFAHLLRRRWRFISVCGAIGGGAALCVALLTGPRFTAKAQFILDPQWAAGTGDRWAAPAMLDPAAVESHVAILTSDSRLQQLLESLKSPSPSSGADEGDASRFDFRRIDQETLAKSFSAFKERQSRVIALTYVDSDPARAAFIVNRAVRLYLGAQADRNTARRSDPLSRVRERIPQVKADLERSEAAIEAFQTNMDATEHKSADRLDGQISSVNKELLEARSELSKTEAKLATLVALRVNGNGAGFVASTSGAQNRSDDGLVGIEAARVEAESRVRDLLRRQSMLQDARIKLREPEARLGELLDTAAAYRRLHNDLIMREKSALEQSEIRVLSAAIPPAKPSSPSPFLFMLPGFVLATIAATMFAVVREQLDDRIRTERDITEGLGLPCLGVIPQRQTQRHDKAEDAILSVALAVLGPAIATATSRVILVTSPTPEADAALVARGIAGAGGQLERRILLIDLDFSYRRADAGSDPAQVSTSRSLAGPSSAISRLPGDTFDSISLASHVENRLQVIEGRRLSDFVSENRERYDHIILCAGSLLGTLEARFAVPVADRLVLVTEWGKTSLGSVRAALELVTGPVGLGHERVGQGKPSVGIVISEFNMKGTDTYRQGPLSQSLRYWKNR